MNNLFKFKWTRCENLIVLKENLIVLKENLIVSQVGRFLKR